MRVNHNLPAFVSYNALTATQTRMSNCVKRLSTGLRINSAADDAAGLAISGKMRSQYSGLDQAARNTQDGISLIRTADGALGETQSMLLRMRELSVHAADGTLTNEDRDYIQQEFDSLKEAIQAIADTTSFNKRKLFDGTFNFLGTSSDFYAALVQSNSTVGGGIEDISGNYKITVNSKAGAAEILKSGILYAANGTKTSVNDVTCNDRDKTGLQDVGAVNMAAGTYSLETREVPFGGTIFYENGTVVTNANAYASTHGVTALAAPGINGDGEKVPYGEYDFRATDTVPFMATYDLEADGSGAVACVEPPTGGSYRSKNDTNAPGNGTYDGVPIDRAVNAGMSFTADAQVAVDRKDTLLWNTGGDITDSEYINMAALDTENLLTERDNYEKNMFTAFDVTVQDRWRVASSVYGNGYWYEDENGDDRYRDGGYFGFSIKINDIAIPVGSDIEAVQTLLDASWTDYAPDYVSNTDGQLNYTLNSIEITMSGSGDARVRADAWNRLISSINSNFGTAALTPGGTNPDSDNGTIKSLTVTPSAGQSLQTANVTARDRISVTASYEGVDINGNYVSGSESNDRWIGFGTAITFTDTNMAYTNINFENLIALGDATSDPPVNPPGDPPVNDYVYNNWGGYGYSFDFATYTSPEVQVGYDIITSQTAIQNSARVGNPPFSDNDDRYAWPEIDYVFTGDFLDGKTIGAGSGEICVPQLYRANYYYMSGNNTYNNITRYSLYHQFKINGEFQTSEDAIAYGFRASDPVPDDGYKFDHKAKAFYGKDTTSYFDKAGDPDDYFKDIKVFAPENSNAALAFRYRGADASGNHVFDIGVKGYETDGTAFDYKIEGAAIDAAGGRLTLDNETGIDGIGSVTFDEFEMNWDLLTSGDAFIVNVSAAALAIKEIKANNADADGRKEKLTDFSWGTDTVTTSGHPQGNAQMGASSEYRFIDGAVKGETVELLGYFVDPIDGADEELGIQNQGFEMTFASGGIMPPQGTKSGTLARSTADAYAYAGPPDLGRGKTIHAEVNYVGASDPVAAAVIGSYYFDRLNATYETAVGVTNFVRGVRYNQEQEWNGSLLFDVVDISGSDIRFRIQGHLYDGNGNYRYVEDHDFWLRPGTNNNLTLFAGDGYEGLNSAPSFRGLLFDTIELAADTSLFRGGDRFTLSLAADAREGGGMSGWDELNLTGEGLGTGYPLTWRFREGVLDNSMTELKLFQVDSKPVSPNGTDVTRNDVLDGYFRVLAGDYHNGTQYGDLATGSDTPRSVKGAAEFTVSEAKGFDARLAHYYTKLKDIKNFYDASGRFLLDTPRTINVRAGGDSVSVTLYGEMEVKDMVEAFAEALYRLGGDYLEEKFSGGMIFSGTEAVKAHSKGFHDETHLAEWFNRERRESGYETVPGTFLLRSFEAGKEGEYHFTGNSDLLDALTFMTIQKSGENRYSVLTEDAHTGKFVARATAWSGTVCDEILPGDAAIKFDARFGVKEIVFNERTGRYDFDMGDGRQTFYAHIAAQDTRLQVGANRKETFRFNIRDMGVESLGLSDVYVTDAASAKRAVTVVDNAIGLVSYQRAKLGAYRNRLEHTISDQMTASTNTRASESRIRDADMPEEMMGFTKLNILSRAGNSMMSQANQLPRNILNLLRQ
jgi:flagellin-like hook-associated protein FlgL